MCEVTHGLAGRVPHVVLRDGQLALGVPAHTAGEHREGHRALVVKHVLKETSGAVGPGKIKGERFNCEAGIE